MCGINGIFRYDKKSLDYRKLEIMNNLLMHRGPDGNGIKLFDHIGLAHTRLSIIDLNIRGKQPMVSHNKNSWIVYNGEIYNYLELRSQLIDLGYQFKTKTDTEVILHAYDCWGNKAFSKFNGMFALSIYDSSSRKLICARDRFGIKPLYYFQDSNKFIFSSEIKPILSVLDKTPEIDKQVLFNYLYYGRVNYSNATFFGGILNLSPGHYIEITSSGCSKEEKWWNFTHSQRPSSIKILRKLFEDSVKLRMRSDVPVGACLSGGIDSTSIVNTALKFTNKDFSTYSAITDDNWPNSENKYIHLVNKKNRLSSNYIKPNGPNLIKNLKKIVKIQEEPFTTPAIYSQWEVMKLANKKGSKVLLDGQGADEILGGYHYFYSYFLFELYKKHKYFELIFEMIQIYIKISKNINRLRKTSTPISSLYFIAFS